MKRYNFSDLYVCELRCIKKVNNPSLFDINYDTRLVYLIICNKVESNKDSKYVHIATGKSYFTPDARKIFKVGDLVATNPISFISLLAENPEILYKQIKAKDIKKLEILYNKKNNPLLKQNENSL